jgi:hypothetical protein
MPGIHRVTDKNVNQWVVYAQSTDIFRGLLCLKKPNQRISNKIDKGISQKSSYQSKILLFALAG